MPELRVTDLRCEYLVDPLGIDERAPRLSWRIESSRRGARQVAWRIRVAGRWDSGRIEGDQTTHVAYAGPALHSRDVCEWTVEAWDETGACARSAPARWTMGLLEPADWSARWIAADPAIIARDPEALAPTLTQPGTPAVFRRLFAVPSPVARATLYATARGIVELQLGGRRVGEDYFAPEWTDYRTRIQYRTYDVTAHLRTGDHALQVMLGDGWWSGYIGWQEARGRYGSLENSVAVQLEIELVGGERLTIATDASWQAATGPILSSDFQMGEVYDARRECPRVDGWLPAREVAPPAVPLVAQRAEPVRITETLAPVSCIEIKPGVFIHDLGQNIAGFVRLQLPALAAGTRLTLRHGERLSPDGTLYTENLRRAKATDVYVTRGSSATNPDAVGGKGTSAADRGTSSHIVETWQPHFTFHGFQYVELTGYPGTPPPDVLVGCVVQSATPPAGHFECSHAGVNRLWLNGVWSQRDNFLSVPTDCPQRDERLGWMGDAQVFLRTASYNADIAAFFTKWMVDVEDAQSTDGVFPDIAPRVPEGEGFVGLDQLQGGAGWADAGVIVPWTLWRVYGDTRIIERHWGAMTRWLDWLERTNPRAIREHELGNNYGDWLCIPTDTSFRTHSPMKTLLATAYWADDAAKMARMSRALGRATEADKFDAVFRRVRAAFQREWVRDDGRLAVETQTAYLVALAFDLLPEGGGAQARAAAHLVEDIRALGWHLSTGFIGISHLNPTLTLTGHNDVAYRLLLQETFPSWLYPVLHGATTIWERWNGWTEEDGFFNPHMNSFNHYSLGSIGEWLFRHVAGIELDDAHPGFQRFVLRPFPDPSLTFARARYRTMHGEISSAWEQGGGRFTWAIRVPPNAAARVFVPADRRARVATDGLAIVARDDTWVELAVPAGEYRLVVESTGR